MGMLTVSERQKLARLRKEAQKVPPVSISPAEAFIFKAVREMAHEGECVRKRIKWGIVALLAILVGIVLVWP